MKNDNDINIKSCASGDLVAYLYDELTTPERSSFETHLADCGRCTDEFAELSFARLEVYEWHRDEFAGLETPRFVIPYARANVSWMDAVRVFFAANRQWATAGGAFALIAVVFGAVLISSSFKGGADLVQGPTAVDVAANKIQPVVLPVAPSSADAEKNLAASPDVSNSESRVINASSAEKGPKTGGTIRRPVKNSERIQSKPVQAQRKTAPRLNDFEDEIDNTLRLGDLLADVDTRD